MVSSDNDKNESKLVVDVHSHFMPGTLPDFCTRYGYSGFVSLSKEDGSSSGLLKKGSKELFKVPSSFWDIEDRLNFLSNNDIDAQVVSPPASLFSYWAKADDTADLCRIINNSIKQECDKFPQNFIPLFIVPMQAPELAVAEVERCMKLGFKGCAIGTHVNEWNLDATELVPFWEICEENSIAVFVHSNDFKVTRKDRKYWLSELIGAPHEMNRAITTTLLGGILEQFPKLKLSFTDGGGSFPYIHGKVEQSYHLKPEKVATSCDLSPKAFLNKFMCDSVVGSAEALSLLVKVVGEDNVVFGTNYPFLPTNVEESVDSKSGYNNIGKTNIEEAESISEAAQGKILSSNALKLLNLTEEDIKPIR